MDTRDRERLGESDDRTFERLLLESARADGVSDARVQRAWSELARASSGFAPSTAEAHGWRAWLRSAAVKGWLVGVLCGGAITAAWLIGTRSTDHASPRITPAHTSSAPSSAASAPARTITSDDAIVNAQPIAASVAPPARARAASQRAARVKHATPSVLEGRAAAAAEQNMAEHTAAVPGPALAAEVAALDAVRSAIMAASYLRALRLIDDYHRAFPAGQLAPDADALAIEALAARGDSTSANQHAARFLDRYPNSPHAARITALIGRAAH